MNQDSSADLSPSASPSADAISRRAYEIWEREGRPDGCDLRHWLEAEQELRTPGTGALQSQTTSNAPRDTGTDVRPLQGTRAAAAAARDPKRGAAAPFGNDRVAPAPSQPTAAKRKSSSAPVM